MAPNFEPKIGVGGEGIVDSRSWVASSQLHQPTCFREWDRGTHPFECGNLTSGKSGKIPTFGGICSTNPLLGPSGLVKPARYSLAQRHTNFLSQVFINFGKGKHAQDQPA